MNIERLYPIWFILCSLAGAAIGIVTGYGAIRGLTDGMLIAVLPLFLIGLTYLLLRLWRPDLPTCRCGQCSYKGYRYVGQADGVEAGNSFRFRCPKCERVYELTGGRFDEIKNDGRTVPYLHHTKWGRWKKTVTGHSPTD